ncbi:MAG: peptide chain release factor N(5)-glutamine methyltransferase [Nonlabens sp.]
MTLNALKKHFVKELGGIYQEGEARSILQILCEDLLHWTRTDFFIKNRDDLSSIENGVLLKALENLKANQPVQHITGIAHFYGHTFKVTPQTLIPRQETEELVDMIITDHKSTAPATIIDIGTGTGCIGISLGLAFAKANSTQSNTQIKTQAKTEVTLVDVSSEALEVAKENAARLDLKKNTNFVELDILKATELPLSDVIVSNPPYVRELEKVEIHKNVLEHDPELALFVDDEDPLIFYRKIMELAQPSLEKGGLLYFEINQYLSREMEELAKTLHLNHKLYRDLNGNWRMMKCWID